VNGTPPGGVAATRPDDRTVRSASNASRLTTTPTGTIASVDILPTAANRVPSIDAGAADGVPGVRSEPTVLVRAASGRRRLLDATLVLSIPLAQSHRPASSSFSVRDKVATVIQKGVICVMSVTPLPAELDRFRPPERREPVSTAFALVREKQSIPTDFSERRPCDHSSRSAP
jgi:hypothetical protein